MIPNCNCLGCQNIAKRLKKPDRAQIEPNPNRFESDYNVGHSDENCIPKSNANVRYECKSKTSDFYQTMNIPERFERPCK